MYILHPCVCVLCAYASAYICVRACECACVWLSLSRLSPLARRTLNRRTGDRRETESAHPQETNYAFRLPLTVCKNSHYAALIRVSHLPNLTNPNSRKATSIQIAAWPPSAEVRRKSMRHHVMFRMLTNWTTGTRRLARKVLRVKPGAKLPVVTTMTTTI